MDYNVKSSPQKPNPWEIDRKEAREATNRNKNGPNMRGHDLIEYETVSKEKQQSNADKQIEIKELTNSFGNLEVL